VIIEIYCGDADQVYLTSNGHAILISKLKFSALSVPLLWCL